jgi:hypothetical protein
MAVLEDGAACFESDDGAAESTRRILDDHVLLGVDDGRWGRAAARAGQHVAAVVPATHFAVAHLRKPTQEAYAGLRHGQWHSGVQDGR